MSSRDSRGIKVHHDVMVEIIKVLAGCVFGTKICSGFIVFRRLDECDN